MAKHLLLYPKTSCYILNRTVIMDMVLVIMDVIKPWLELKKINPENN
jgi:hypothetical protein